MRRIVFYSGITLTLLFLCACKSPAVRGLLQKTEVTTVARAGGPIQESGRLSEATWRQATPLSFITPAAKKDCKTPEFRGTARLLHDDKNLYVAFDFEDADLVDLSTKNDEELHTLADVGEIFLKPKDDTWYWEFHVTPKGRISSYWFPGRGRLQLVGTQPHVQDTFIKVDVESLGTINRWQDRDKGWRAIVTIPFKNLDRFGPPKDPHNRWSMLLARYDYSRYRERATGPELTTYTNLSEVNFHLLQEYPRLKLEE